MYRIIVHTEIMILIFVASCSWGLSVLRGFSFNRVPGCKKLNNLHSVKSKAPDYRVHRIPERCCSLCPSFPIWKVIWTKYRKPSFLFMFSVFDDPDVFSMLQLENLMWIDLHFEMKLMKGGLVTQATFYICIQNILISLEHDPSTANVDSSAEQ